MKKIVFLTATRAEYGKMKPLMQEIEKSKYFELFVFVSGMHMLPEYGDTYKEIIKDKYINIYLDKSYSYTPKMDIALTRVISKFSKYTEQIKPDLIIVHGDRLDALAGAIVGAFNNILVAHIEGGEISGTIDESIRHSISKLSHLHLVANNEARKRLIQLGEKKDSVFIIGSPDIDVMINHNLPFLKTVQARYDIPFEEYAIMIYHPVVTEIQTLQKDIHNIVNALLETSSNFVIIMPNNDPGNEIIQNEYKRLIDNKKFRILQSMRFEYFLTLLKNAQYILGNSSAGIRESGVYGIPAIDIGTRQQNRYCTDILKNVQNLPADSSAIKKGISKIYKYKVYNDYFGDGKSSVHFMNLLKSEKFWKTNIQKVFIDLEI